MLPATAGNTVLVMLHPSARTFSIPPAYLARFPNTTHWRITVEPDGIKVSPEQAPPPVDYDEPTQEEIQAAIAETRAANSVNSDPQHATHRHQR